MSSVVNDALLLGHFYLNLVTLSSILTQSPEIPYPSSVTVVFFQVPPLGKPLGCIICIKLSLYNCD